jgi:threonine dehydrogenase-like Zn-dependent dehydrogenase
MDAVNHFDNSESFNRFAQNCFAMKAAQFKKPRLLEIIEAPLRKLAPTEVLVKISACGVCGTDVHIFAGEAHARPPVILGHEFAGTVVEVGNQVRDLRPGDHVAVDPNIACGGCYYCRRGQVNFCENLRALGVDIDGGFAEFTIAPAQQYYQLRRICRSNTAPLPSRSHVACAASSARRSSPANQWPSSAPAISACSCCNCRALPVPV